MNLATHGSQQHPQKKLCLPGRMARRAQAFAVLFVLAGQLAVSHRPNDKKNQKPVLHAVPSLIQVESDDARMSGSFAAARAVEKTFPEPAEDLNVLPARVMRDFEAAEDAATRRKSGQGGEVVKGTSVGSSVSLSASASGLIQAAVAAWTEGAEAKGGANIFVAKPDVMGEAAFIQVSSEDSAVAQFAHHHQPHAAYHGVQTLPGVAHNLQRKSRPQSHFQVQHALQQSHKRQHHHVGSAQQLSDNVPHILSKIESEASPAVGIPHSAFTEVAAVGGSSGLTLEDGSLSSEFSNAKIEALEQELAEAKVRKLEAEISVVRAATPDVEHMSIIPASAQYIKAGRTFQSKQQQRATTLHEGSSITSRGSGPVSTLDETDSDSELADTVKGTGHHRQTEIRGSLIDSNSEESRDDSKVGNTVVSDTEESASFKESQSDKGTVASKDASEDFQSCEADAREAGDKGIQALQKCVDHLETYAKLARDQRSISEDSNGKYRSAFNTAVDMFQALTKKHRTLDAMYIQDQHQAYHALNHRITAIAKELQEMDGSLVE